MYNQIIDHLFIGGLYDAETFRKNKPDGIILCVLENRPMEEPFKAYHIPIITESGHVHTDQLDHIAYFLETLLAKKCDVLVHCFPKDIIILGDNKIISEYQIGDSVIDSKGDLQLVTNTFKHNYEGKIINLKIRGLPPIKATNEHPFLIYRPYQEPNGRLAKPNWYKTMPNYTHIKRWNKKQPIWVQAEDLRIGDYLLTPKFKNSKKQISVSIPIISNKYNNGKKFNPIINPSNDLAWFFGFYIADGSTLGKYSFGLTLGKKDDIKRIIQCIESFGIKPSIRYYENYIRIGCNSKSITTWLKNEFGSNSKTKKIPDWLLTWNTIEVLNGIVDGDGFRSTNRNSITIFTTSKILAYQTWWLLTSQKQFPLIREFKRHSGYPNPSQAWQISWTEDAKHHHTAYWKDYYCLPILETKEENYTGIVYNLEVENSHNYIANCVITHNCAAGIERSPLAVAYFIAYSKGIPIEEAYKIVKKGRPQTQERIMWLKRSYE